MITEYYTYKFRLYPTQEQMELINKTLGSCRFLYNKMLDDRIEHLERGVEAELKSTDYKHEFTFLKEVDPLALYMVQVRSEEDWNNARGKDKTPFYKSRNSSETYTTMNADNRIKIIEGKYVILPKVGKIRIKIHRPIDNGYILKQVCIIKRGTNKYFVSLICVRKIKRMSPIPIIDETAIGLDYSQTSFYVDDNGNSPNNYEHFYKGLEKKIEHESRKLSKMNKGSHNYEKQRLKIAKLHQKISNKRNDLLHKESSKLAEIYDAVCVENLSVQEISKTYRLGRNSMDNAYGKFKVMLKYKLKAQGKNYIQINKWMPSSKKCNVCGYYHKTLKLQERSWTCPNCNTKLDRDQNAAKNIKEWGIKHYS